MGSTFDGRGFARGATLGLNVFLLGVLLGVFVAGFFVDVDFLL